MEDAKELKVFTMETVWILVESRGGVVIIISACNSAQYTI